MRLLAAGAPFSLLPGSAAFCNFESGGAHLPCHDAPARTRLRGAPRALRGGPRSPQYRDFGALPMIDSNFRFADAPPRPPARLLGHPPPRPKA